MSEAGMGFLELTHVQKRFGTFTAVEDFDLSAHRGEFVSFLTHEVLKGRLVIRTRDSEIAVGAGELCVIPRGIEHQPYAEEEVHLLLIEPSGTPNTGDRATAAPRQVL